MWREAHPEQDPEENIKGPDAEVLAATHLWQYGKRSHSGSTLSLLAADLKCGNKLAFQILMAASESCVRSQQKTLHDIIEYIQCLQHSGSLLPLAFAHRVSYDETPMLCKVAFGNIASANSELSKVFVIESSWSALVLSKTGKPEPVLLQGHFSPAVRAADGVNGPAIATALRSVFEGQVPSAVGDLFPFCVRVSEHDEAPANARAERMWKTYAGDYSLLTLPCVAHKVHACSEKATQMVPWLMTGLTRTLLAVQGATQFRRLKSALRGFVSDNLQILPANTRLSQDALAFRRLSLSLWLPHRPRKKAIVLVVAATLLNADWRQPQLQHICKQCCKDAADCKEKTVQWLEKLIDTLRPNKLCRSNWAEWAHPLSYIGLLSDMHRLLPSLYKRAFAGVDEDAAQVPLRSSVLLNLLRASASSCPPNAPPIFHSLLACGLGLGFRKLLWHRESQ